jgi:PIN domain nuclease of toxin-antitoxin system
MAIKINVGKLNLVGDFKIIPDQIKKNGFEVLAIKVKHISKVSTLVNHHKDPFDRLIISQSIIGAHPLIL